ncbi:MAG: hypothetical protein K1W20_04865 [Lachnospiraceae bacterium]
MGKVTDTWTSEGKRFMATLQELAGMEVRIGYQRGTLHLNDDGSRADLVDIAMWNEFGTENMPSRPFMRDSVDKHMQAINHVLLSQKDALLKGASAKDVLNTVGLFQQDLIQTEIEQGDFVANASSTIEKKGSDKPLIDTGTMKNSVHFQIVKKGSMD